MSILSKAVSILVAVRDFKNTLVVRVWCCHCQGAREPGGEGGCAL